MVESTKPGLLDLEKELTCSVSFAGNIAALRYSLHTADCEC